MRFYFGLSSHESGDDLAILDAHPSADHSCCPYLLDEIGVPIERPPSGINKIRKQLPRADQHHPNPAGDDDDAASLSVNSKWRSIRGHHDEVEEGRPRHRQFFRLGRHRSRSSTNLSDEHKSLSPPPPGRRRSSPSNKARIMSLRRPTMKRSVSLPHDLKVAITAGVSQSCTPCCDSQRTVKEHRQHVTFSNVQIREYSRILGDHPCCPSGLPLALGWDTEREDSFRLEEYEKKRHPTRRSKEDLRLGCQDRREILESLIVSPTSSDSEGESSGCCMYSKAEIRKVERRLNRERAENYRAVKKINHRFFKPLEHSEDVLKPQDEDEIEAKSQELE